MPSLHHYVFTTGSAPNSVVEDTFPIQEVVFDIDAPNEVSAYAQMRSRLALFNIVDRAESYAKICDLLNRRMFDMADKAMKQHNTAERVILSHKRIK